MGCVQALRPLHFLFKANTVNYWDMHSPASFHVDRGVDSSQTGVPVYKGDLQDLKLGKRGELRQWASSQLTNSLLLKVILSTDVVTVVLN